MVGILSLKYVIKARACMRKYSKKIISEYDDLTYVLYIYSISTDCLAHLSIKYPGAPRGLLVKHE